MRAVKAVTVEAVLVAVAALIVALLANAISPRGLQLTRDYFPRAEAPATAAGAGAASAIVRRLEQRGLRAASLAEVSAWFRGEASGPVVFIDARDERQFASGHIPGAWQFDHYHPEQSLPAVLPLCLTAVKVVVYCAGGRCEDSEFAAVMLRDAGVPREKLFVYPGGVAEWSASRLPLETGARGSGQMRTTTP